MDSESELNSNVISEFEKLVRYVRFQINNDKSSGNVKSATANGFRLKQISGALKTIKAYKQELKLTNLDDIAKYQGIGKGTIDRIKQILTKGALDELKNWDDPEGKYEPIIKELETIVGVGRKTALDLIYDGITSVQDLKNKVEKGKIEVNEQIALGLAYHNKFFDNIPRDEITAIKELLTKILKKINKKYIFEICGSYRREKPTSGDIDVLITLENSDDIENHLPNIIKVLKSPIKTNDNKPLLVDDMTSKNFETKYMGFAQLLSFKDSKVRRIDIRFVPFSSYPTALLYFTGSAELNKRMRKIAKNLGYKLSEYNIKKIDDDSIVSVKSEKDVFDILHMDYLPPRLR